MSLPTSILPKKEAKNISLMNHIGENYHQVVEDLEQNNNTHYWLDGGRGSLKSSFVFLYVSYMLTKLTYQGFAVHCVALRKIKETIKDSIYNNFEWAFDVLGVSNLWNGTSTPMKFKFKDSSIIFRGSKDRKDMEKIKSIKFKKGELMFVIFEELTEFDGWQEILTINQSLFRGTNNGKAFYMYNPPASKSNWVNEERENKKPSVFYHSSTYLEAPYEWLGKIFIDEAENLKQVNERLYNHMYLGHVIGEGLEIYQNTEIRSITDDEIKTFTIVYRGLDFGFASDASHYIECYYDEKTMILYIFNEVYGHGMTNQTLYNELKPLAGSFLIYADCAEPRTINELRMLGLNIRGAKKGKDSKNHGIKFLASLSKIIIDKKRCPYASNQFVTYEYKKDNKDEIILEYPKEPHGSAGTRYALNNIILQNKMLFI
jgi:PBSX family phage terminase large subunit